MIYSTLMKLIFCLPLVLNTFLMLSFRMNGAFCECECLPPPRIRINTGMICNLWASFTFVFIFGHVMENGDEIFEDVD
ncbi:hypothetical protein L6452_33063 [Arctium lappa]|uniref:Uncharacterized protein n=1 Tax=Arctium lappa TaxID=4217 RepID=A0ACB8Z697_ARCLA|nr:hypothetical protein L6452_33063 [Arctium lappa]